MLGIVALVLVGLYLGLFLGPSQTPKLGLDLRGGTQVILTATSLTGGAPSKGALDQAVNIIRQRVDAAGVGGAQINTQGNNTIIVSAPGVGRDKLAALDQTALLRFRQVLAVGSGAAPQPAPSVTSSASTSSSPSPTAKKSSKGDAMSAALVKASPSPTPTPSASRSAPSSGASPAPG